MKKAKIIYSIIIGLVVIFLLIFHTFSFGDIIVDTTSILLLVILIIIPFAPNLRKIKWGDFEAELSLPEAEKKLQQIEIEKELTQNYFEKNPEISSRTMEPKTGLTVAELEAQINSLLTQLAILQRQLSEVEIQNEKEKEKAQEHKDQINSLIMQLSALQAQLNALKTGE